MSADCLFCRIVAGEIPSERVFESDEVLAFRDIAPAAPTHVLVIPKRHVRDVTEVTDEHRSLLATMIASARTVAEAEGIAASGYRLIFNVGADAGQTVFHLHLHVVGGKPLGGVA